MTGDDQAPDEVELKIDTSGSRMSASAQQIEQRLRQTGILLVSGGG